MHNLYFLKQPFLKARAFCLLVILSLPILWAIEGQPQALAATFNVGSSDVNGLRNAINNANNNGGANVIELGGGTYNITNSAGDFLGATGLPAIQSDITINGNGATIQRGGGNFRFFYVATDAKLTLNNMTLVGGNLSNPGGAINNLDGTLVVNSVTFNQNFSGAAGGAIYSTKTVSIANSTFNNNASPPAGGAIFIQKGNADVSGSTFNSNSATGPGGGVLGGAIYINQGSLSVSTSTFEGNTSPVGSGGAIGNDHATVTVTGSTFNNNKAKEKEGFGGGAIYTYINSNLQVISSGFKGNRAGGGAAIFNVNGTLNVNSGTFESNVATGGGLDSAGGAISNSGSAIISNSSFTTNSAPGGGFAGAIYNYLNTGNGGSPTLTINKSTFTGNFVTTNGSGNPAAQGGFGGALYNYGSPVSMTINDSTFSQNSGPSSGGVLYNEGGDVTINNSTFSGNTAANASGGALMSAVSPAYPNALTKIAVNNSTVANNQAGGGGGGLISSSGNSSRAEAVVTNSTFSGNTAGAGGSNLYNDGNSTLTVRNTLIVNGSCGGNTAFAAGTNNLVFPGPSACGAGSTVVGSNPLGGNSLADNGGQTKTIALADAPNSAIDGASAGLCPAKDQRGFGRNGTCDVGAYERNGIAPPPDPKGTVTLLRSSFRIADATNGNSPALTSTGSAPSIGNSSTVQITAWGVGGIPNTATGIMGVLTNVGCSGGANFRFWTGGAAPNASNLNVPGANPALNLSTGFTAPLDASGKVYLGLGSGVSTTCKYVVDVIGYLTNPGDGASSLTLLGSSFRIADAANGNSPALTSTGAIPTIGDSSTTQITAWGVGGIPNTATGIVGVLTNVGCSGGANFRFWTGGTAPNASNLNVPGAFAALNLSTNFIAPLDASGKVYLGLASGVSTTCKYVVDVVGYLAPAGTGSDITLLSGTARLATTQGNARPTLVASGGTPTIGNSSTTQLPGVGSGGIPTGAKGVVGVLTNLSCNAGGNFRFWTGGTAPFASNLNVPGASPALNLSTGFVAPLDPSSGRVYLGLGSGASANCGYIFDVLAYLT